MVDCRSCLVFPRKIWTISNRAFDNVLSMKYGWKIFMLSTHQRRLEYEFLPVLSQIHIQWITSFLSFHFPDILRIKVSQGKLKSSAPVASYSKVWRGCQSNNLTSFLGKFLGICQNPCRSVRSRADHLNWPYPIISLYKMNHLCQEMMQSQQNINNDVLYLLITS